MKKYVPIKMIRAGRYKVCFDGLESEVRADVQRRMETLLAENAEWCDRGELRSSVQHTSNTGHRRGSTGTWKDG